MSDLASAYAAKRRKAKGTGTVEPEVESNTEAPREMQDMDLFDQLEQQTELPSEPDESDEVVESQEQSPLDDIMRKLRMSKMRG